MNEPISQENDHILHITIGPVQGFVAEARRIRDLWAGSFLLSWLAAHAMHSVIDKGGQIVFPTVKDEDTITDPLLNAVDLVKRAQIPADNPLIGSLPNRFKAHIPASLDPKNIVEDVNNAWCKIADQVFEQLRPALEQDAQRYDARKALWDDQISNFWEINWVKGPINDSENIILPEHQWLDLRKNWRSRWLTEQHGEKCSLMGDWQELSLYSVYETRERDAFWASLRDNNRVPNGERNLRDGEYLCAISLVKRFFPSLPQSVLKDSIGWVPGGDKRSLSNWPSTTYMAILPWLMQAYQTPSHHAALKDYVNAVEATINTNGDQQLVFSEQTGHFPQLTQHRNPDLQAKQSGRFADDLDGDLLLDHALANANATPLSVAALHQAKNTHNNNRNQDPDSSVRNTLLMSLTNLYRKLGTAGQANRPRSYYAIVLMDGDRLGKLLQQSGNAAGTISQALNAFSQNVTNTVTQHNGITIYAGGDDVLALLPLDQAIDCANSLNQAYRNAFASKGLAQATASTAIVFTHHQYPLSNSLRHAHFLLDHIAKDINGRDSCAISVLNSGGEHLRWRNTWDACQNTDSGSTPLMALQALIKQLENEQLPRGYMHKLEHNYGSLQCQESANTADQTSNEQPPLFNDEELRDLFIAELLTTRESSSNGSNGSNGSNEQDNQKRSATAQQTVENLLSASALWSRPDQSEEPVHQYGVQFDAGLIARFLTRNED